MGYIGSGRGGERERPYETVSWGANGEGSGGRSVGRSIVAHLFVHRRLGAAHKLLYLWHKVLKEPEGMLVL